ncbi:MAG: HEAT repeat domain-containing protein [Chloroflexi bacterium]|nr:HEAT repeat domain-containing protein [Chloroflexota bacterium]OJW04151.1 MAG: hypothetical protein BGO39_06615 [Chloroflexi bacterium 54-19]
MTTFELEKDVKEKLYRALALGIITVDELESLPVRLGCLALNLIDAKKEEEGVSFQQAVKWLLQRRTEIPLWLRNLHPEIYVPGLPPPEITPQQQAQAERFIKLGLAFEFLTDDNGLLYLTNEEIQNYFCAVYCMSQPIENDIFHRTNPDNYDVWSDLDPFLADKVWKFIREGQEAADYPGYSVLRRLTDIGYWTGKTLWAEITHEQVVSLLLDDLKNEDNFIRERASSILAGLVNPRLVEPFLTALFDSNPEVRSHATNGLGTLEEKRAIPRLIELLDDEDDHVRYEAVWALRYIGDPAAVEPLIKTLLFDNYAKKDAATVLGYFKDRRAVEPLIEVLGDNWANVRASAAESLGDIGDKRAIEPLARLLNDKEERVRFMAAYGLGMLGDKRSFPILVNTIQKKGKKQGRARGEAWRAAEALGNCGDKRAVNPLLDALAGNSERIRVEIAIALGKLGYSTAIGPLIELLDDKSSSVRFGAAQALGQLAAETALPKLKEMSMNDEGENLYGRYDQTVKEAAAQAIQEIENAVEKRKNFPNLLSEPWKN